MGLLSFSFFALWVLEIVAAQPKTEPREVDAINKIIDHWNLRSKLNLTDDPCNQNASWAATTANPRIACDCSDTVCHITHLKIYALDVYGEIPQELFLLTELMDLNLNQNVINGSIPRAIGQLSKMEYLAMGINNLTGPVPSELGNMTKLLSLSFGSNNLQGNLPPELGKLTALQQLYIDSSGVSGPIPHELSNLKSLQILWASDNRLTGKIPEFLGTFKGLKVLRLEGTNLEGPIPGSFRTLTKLEDLRISDLDASDNSLDFVENLTSLSILSLRNCQIGGKIPEKLSAFPNLKILDLSFNKLTGQIPASFKNFSSLEYLYLGSNNLNGDLPSDVISPKLIALDVSFNPFTGNVPPDRKDISINVVGTSINDVNLKNEEASMLHCLQGNTKCRIKDPSTSFSVNCGGTEQVSENGIKYDDDSNILGAASLYTSTNNQWAVSSSGIFISNPNGPRYKVETDTQITNTLDSELYKTARISPNSLRYYGLGLENGVYQIELHFAEIQMDDSTSWKGLGRRLFDVYIQGKKVLEDFNILSEAGGSKKALIKTFNANVTNSVMDIHLLWAGKGTCCIPFQSTYGPLVSAIHVSQVSEFKDLSGSKKNRTGKILGIAIGCGVGLLIACSILYVWWAKKEPGHMRIPVDSPRKD
ncbi:Leucine-rich repeat (LRR) protein associated with apoptosis in muscle tissue [Handroanthus impetiginosus]|uniref:non-specific serine/threonine protein kinase n=1 Tax=Handroanthus impetiginosus TaxID=429701 RepID=A0A2G9GX82_9LAMI|nr:Leucine-rich repeat (LRR) protein associated with apoptosis in muscle tissue [Handroanthus impetiginosus]